MDTCVITGLSGSGKTVLLSTLVLKHKEHFFPLNTEAMDLQNNLAQALKNNQEWPPPTNPHAAEQEAMEWTFMYNGVNYPLWVADKAGEAWAKFVLENRDPDPAVSINDWKKKIQAAINGLTVADKKELGKIKQQFSHAACVCILIDLSVDINEGWDGEQMTFVQSVVNYLDNNGKSKCPIALVVTKSKTYGDDAKWKPIFEDGYGKSAKARCKGKVDFIYTDAVADTKNGKPVPGFGSKGLDELIKWLGTQLNSARKKRIRKIAAVSVAAILILACTLCWVAPCWILLILVIMIALVIINTKRIF